MLHSTTFALIASAALLATAGCTMDKVDRVGSGVLQPAATITEPASGQELHLMFDAEKRNALIAELPAQF